MCSFARAAMPLTVLSRCATAAGISPRMSFIGGGNMATALFKGAIAAGYLSPDEVAVTVRSEASAEKWRNNGVKYVYTNNTELMRNKDFAKGVIVLAVKPQMRQAVFREIEKSTDWDMSKCPLMISVMAGISTKSLREELAPTAFSGSLIRLMPNTPCQVGAGASVLAADADVKAEMITLATRFAESVGSCTRSDEKMFNACSAIAGCGPAFAYMFIEALADGGVLAGCSRDQAMQLAAQTVMGAAKLVLESGDHPGLLKDKVCSPAGTTIAGVRELEKRGFRSAAMEAVKAAADRADQM